MKQISILIATLLLSVSTYAIDGSSSIDFRGASAGFDYIAFGNEVTGSIYGMGTSGRVQIQRDERGSWSGRIGRHQVNLRHTDIRIDDDGVVRTRSEIRVLPGGSYSFFTTFHDSLMKFNLRGNVLGPRRDLRMHGRVQGTEFSGGNQYVSYHLNNTGRGSYEGYTHIMHNPNRPGSRYHTRFQSEGDLSPLKLAEKDPDLYAMLYIIPFSLQR